MQQVFRDSKQVFRDPRNRLAAVYYRHLWGKAPGGVSHIFMNSFTIASDTVLLINDEIEREWR